MKICRKIFRVNFYLTIGLAVFASSGISFAQVPNQALANSFALYFCPEALQKIDEVMKNEQKDANNKKVVFLPNDELWQIWLYGFERPYKSSDKLSEKTPDKPYKAMEIKVVMSWDGFFYNKKTKEQLGDWTKFNPYPPSAARQSINEFFCPQAFRNLTALLIDSGYQPYKFWRARLYGYSRTFTKAGEDLEVKLSLDGRIYHNNSLKPVGYWTALK